VIAGPAGPCKRAGDLARVVDSQQAMNDRSTVTARMANHGTSRLPTATLSWSNRQRERSAVNTLLINVGFVC